MIVIERQKRKALSVFYSALLLSQSLQLATYAQDASAQLEEAQIRGQSAAEHEVIASETKRDTFVPLDENNTGAGNSKEQRVAESYKHRYKKAIKSAKESASKTELSDTADDDKTLQNLQENQVLNGFQPRAVYLNDSEKVVGARFRHIKTGFTLDFLRIETAPQAFFWVNTIVTDKSGAPHTQEHLLLGKGNKARRHGSQSDLMLVRESAATDQWRTYYHFNTSAKPSTFHNTVHEYLDLLLNPDYQDEEIRREVRNFQVRKDSSGKLSLEEGGTVYNEMMSTSQRQMNVLWERMTEVLYGPNHPLSAVAGGSPEGIRQLSVEQIRAFHKSHYLLSNMGMIEAVPSELSLAECLSQLNKSLLSLNQEKGSNLALQAKDANNDIPVFPPAKTWKDGDIEFIKWPEKNDRQSGLIEFVWPSTLNLSEKEAILLDLFLSAFASGPGSPLYKMFVDSKTARVNSGATGCGGWTDALIGNPIYISIYDIDQYHMNREDLSRYRNVIKDEFLKIANWKPSDAELLAFNNRVKASLIENQRYYRKMVNTPPPFGERNISATLMNEFIDLERRGGFKRNLTSKQEFSDIAAELKLDKNIWTDYLSKWGLLSTNPCVFGTVPDSSAAPQIERETKERIAVETKRLMQVYKTEDEQLALTRYKDDYDRVTKDLDSSQINSDDIKLVDAPPLSKDDQLKFTNDRILDSVPIVRSYFDNVNSGSTVLALRLDSIPEEDLIYVALLPALLTKTGFIDGDRAYTADEAEQLRKNEIYYLSAYLDTNPYDNRYELKLNAGGTTAEESKSAVKWIERLLHQPNWSSKNLARIQDLLEQEVSSYRAVRNSSHENSWEYGVSAAYRYQQALNLNTRCFLTCAHNIQRVKWRLKSYAPKSIKEAFSNFMNQLGESCNDLSRAEIKSIVSDLSNKKIEHKASQPEKIERLAKAFDALDNQTRNIVSDAAFDLMMDLDDVPDEALTKDVKTLCAELSADLQANPDDTLRKLHELRQLLLCRSGARLSVVGSHQTQDALKEDIDNLVFHLNSNAFTKQNYAKEDLILQRVKERSGFAGSSTLVGFVYPNLQQGMVANCADTTSYEDVREQSLVNGLAINTLSGSGSESLFNRTWAAGLAYSNGSLWSPAKNIMYHADKIPSVPDLYKFTANEVKKAKISRKLLDTAISQNMRSRACMSFETRAEKMSDDIADGITPEIIRKFRQSLLDLRKKSDILNQLQEALPIEYGKILPGLGTKSSQLKNGFYMVLGDEKQLLRSEKYIQDLEGKDAKMTRLWGRDFWINSLD